VLHPDGELTWTESNGGPLLLLPESLLPSWRGVPHDADGVVSGDYGRACAVEGYAGVIPVADGVGLVLGGMLMPSTWAPRIWCMMRTPSACAG
jgi:hypothetical protein